MGDPNINDVIRTIKEKLSSLTGLDKVDLSYPDLRNGDLTTNVALQVYSDSDVTNPREYAEVIKDKLSKDNNISKYISKIEVAGPGFINFWFNDQILNSEIKHILKSNDEYGSTDENKGRKVVVEYSSPNIAKPFGIGHFRSTIIGDAVANLLEATGWKVYRDNHLGDWGTQFGKQIYAIMTWGDEKELEASENPVKELVALYVKFHEEAEKDPSLEDRGREWSKKLEDGDEEARRLWQKCISWSLKEFSRVYSMLGIKFTENDGVGYGESYFETMMKPVIDELEEKQLLKEGEEGAKLVFFPNDKYPPLMIVRKDGATLYSTRDLATDKFRLDKYGKDILIINEVGVDQSLYFQQLYEIEKMMGWVGERQRVHVKHGFLRFSDRKMSTRRGDVIWLQDVINEAIKKAEKFGSDEELSLTVAVGALKWNELKRDPIKDIIFDWKEILSMDGNSGPYVQYTYARSQSIVKKTQSDIDLYDLILKDKELVIARFLSRFPGIVSDASKNYSPSIICNFVYQIAQMYNNFYNSERIVGNEREEERVAVTRAVGYVIKNGLKLLGIKAPEKM